MRVVILLCLTLAGRAQTTPSPDKQQLYGILDQIRANIRADDWREAWRQESRLDSGLLVQLRRTDAPSPGRELHHLEILAGRDTTTRGPQLARMARAAYAAVEWDKAERYAREALDAATHGVFWWTGDAIHQGNIVLGRLALTKGDVDAAKRYLLAAGKTPGSSDLDSTGPSMALAGELLRAGESGAVVQYLDECRTFWRGDRGKLDEWIVLIRAGLKPDFGPNLYY
ncbi:MAG TPA: hypothetical protein VGF59_29830 [Bryobacteraceae bacterium]|jgi:hypothetical protein